MAHFIVEFINNPTEVGSIIPSSGWLGDSMLSGLDLSKMQTIVEYGPGTGAFTRKIYPQLHAGCAFIGVESNPMFADHLSHEFNGIHIIKDYACQVKRYIKRHETSVDLVVSGLPFSLMKWDVVEQTIIDTADILKEGGHFRTFVYAHMMYASKIRKLNRLLQDNFSEVTKEVVMRNIPPAITLKCVK